MLLLFVQDLYPFYFVVPLLMVALIHYRCSTCWSCNERVGHYLIYAWAWLLNKCPLITLFGCYYVKRSFCIPSPICTILCLLCWRLCFISWVSWCFLLHFRLLCFPFRRLINSSMFGSSMTAVDINGNIHYLFADVFLVAQYRASSNISPTVAQCYLNTCRS